MTFTREPWFDYFPDQQPPPPAEGQPPRYIPSEPIVRAVNTALAVGQPLLVMGEPGVGKSALARSIADELGLGKVLLFVTRSDSQPSDVLYHVDHIGRMYDAQVLREQAADVSRYVRLMPLGEALTDPGQRVVLIDEVDKAPRDFSDGLLHELDQMSFIIRETGREVVRSGGPRPFVLITSNEERDLSDAFLRRCVYLRIPFPSQDTLVRILGQHVRRPPQDSVVASAATRFVDLRETRRSWQKRPSIGELVTWGRMLVRAGVSADEVRREPWRRLFPELIAKNDADHANLTDGDQP